MRLKRFPRLPWRTCRAVLVPLPFLFALLLVLPTSSAQEATPALHHDAARPAEASGWIRSELYFGIGEGASEHVGQPVIGETEWRAFVDREITPRFPDGLTVLDGQGQWLFRGQAGPNRQAAKVLVILHEDTAQRRNDIEAIRLAWKQATGHQSVLWAHMPVKVSF